MQLNRRAGEAIFVLSRICESRPQGMRIIVQNLRGVFGHETFEHAVEHVDERSARAEVMLEIDDLADLRVAIAKAIRAIEEALRLGKAKSVDTLLHIADAEEVLLRTLT